MSPRRLAENKIRCVLPDVDGEDQHPVAAEEGRGLFGHDGETVGQRTHSPLALLKNIVRAFFNFRVWAALSKNKFH